jgi:hypothetical protein
VCVCVCLWVCKYYFANGGHNRPRSEGNRICSDRLKETSFSKTCSIESPRGRQQTAYFAPPLSLCLSLSLSLCLSLSLSDEDLEHFDPVVPCPQGSQVSQVGQCQRQGAEAGRNPKKKRNVSTLVHLPGKATLESTFF